MSTKLDFDAESVEPLGSMDPLPIGEYTVVISDSEMKTTKNGEGQYLQLTYDVVDGDYQGRKLWDRLNLVNNNKTAQDIAQRSLSSICHAVNVLHPKDSQELHDKPFVVRVGIRPATEDYQATNTIKEYKALDGVSTEKETKKKEDAPKSSKKPWEKSK